MKKKWKRLITLVIGLSLFGLFIFFALASFGQSISFFYSPTEIVSTDFSEKEVRLGGFVKNIRKNEDFVKFSIADEKTQIEVVYPWLSPALMRDGIDVVVSGILKDGIFHASQVLIKHDERYYPQDYQQK